MRQSQTAIKEAIRIKSFHNGDACGFLQKTRLGHMGMMTLKQFIAKVKSEELSKGFL
jgi:hypothetical protein